MRGLTTGRITWVHGKKWGNNTEKPKQRPYYLTWLTLNSVIKPRPVIPVLTLCLLQRNRLVPGRSSLNTLAQITPPLAILSLFPHKCSKV